MSTPLLLRLHRRRLQVTQETVDAFTEELRENGVPGADSGQRRDLFDLVRDCLSYPELLDRICQSSFQAINDGAVLDTDREGQELQLVFERTINFMREVLDLLQRFNGADLPEEPFAGLRQAIEQIQQRRDRLFGSWPWSHQAGPTPDPQIMEEARAAYRRGEVQEIEELLRDLQSSHS